MVIAIAPAACYECGEDAGYTLEGVRFVLCERCTQELVALNAALPREDTTLDVEHMEMVAELDATYVEFLATYPDRRLSMAARQLQHARDIGDRLAIATLEARLDIGITNLYMADAL